MLVVAKKLEGGGGRGPLACLRSNPFRKVRGRHGKDSETGKKAHVHPQPSLDTKQNSQQIPKEP